MERGYEGNLFLSNRKNVMQDGYSLSAGKARVCRIAGALFLLFAAVTLCEPIGTGVLLAPQFACGEQGCTWTQRPWYLLDEEGQKAVSASPAAERTFAAYAERPLVRMGIAGTSAIGAWPFAALLLLVGLALRRLGRGGGEALAAALARLRWAATAALVWAIARPVSDALMASLLSSGTPGGAEWQIPIDLGDMGTALMLAVAAYAVVWALEAGLRAQRDLQSFV